MSNIRDTLNIQYAACHTLLPHKVVVASLHDFEQERDKGQGIKLLTNMKNGYQEFLKIERTLLQRVGGHENER